MSKACFHCYSRPQVQGSPQSRGPFCLGNHILYHNGYAQFGGHIAEVLIFKRGLTRQECQAVNHYLLQISSTTSPTACT